MKNKGYANLGSGGQIRCIMGDVQVAYWTGGGGGLTVYSQIFDRKQFAA